MKKLIALVGLFGGLFFIVGKASAGLPFDQVQGGYINQSVPPSTTTVSQTTFIPVTSFWNTSISASTNPASGTSGSIILPVVQDTISFNQGVSNSTYPARNCITDLTIELSPGTTFFLLDGGTTNYIIYGSNIQATTSTSLSNTWTKHWDHLGPWCGTAGNTTTLSIPAPGTATGANVINVEGYTNITGLASVYDLGQ